MGRFVADVRHRISTKQMNLVDRDAMTTLVSELIGQVGRDVRRDLSAITPRQQTDDLSKHGESDF